MVILATPAFAPWLEDKSDFVKKTLEIISHDVNHREDQFTRLDILCGCVDGLAPKYGSVSHARGLSASEGLSILYGDQAHISLQLEPEKTRTKTEQLATITLQTSSESGSMDITLPLANTLFTNGNHSTLLSSEWRATAGEYVQITPQIQRRNAAISVSGHRADGGLQSIIPATPLTAARPIGSGLGNIVKTLKYIGKTESASKELETKVVEFIGNATIPLTTIQVWALVIPEDVVKAHIKESFSNLRLANMPFRRLFREFEYKEVGYFISRGATLCRVCEYMPSLAISCN